MLRYTKTHEWIEAGDEIGTVGISDYAQKELGTVVFVDLPPVGKLLSAGQEAVILESTKAATDIYSPVSGEVVAVNFDVKETPRLVNEFAEDEGWLFKIKMTNRKEIDSLLNKESYKEMIGS